MMRRVSGDVLFVIQPGSYIMQTGFVVGKEWRLGRAFWHQGFRLRKNRLGCSGGPIFRPIQ